MKILKNMLALTAALAMVGAPVVASAAGTASKLSVARAGTVAKKSSKIGGGGGTIVAIVAALAVIGGVAIAGGGSSKPKSP